MGFGNWTFDQVHNRYTGADQIAKTLPRGLYQVMVDDYGCPVAVAQELKDERTLSFRHGPMASIMDEIDGFWSSADRYKSLGVTHKRGILLHGPAGCGKTGIIMAAIYATINRGGIAVQVSSVQQFSKFMPLMRQVEDGRPVLAVIEDLDSICDYQEEELLEAMDGASSIGHGILFLATTNNLGSIPVRVRCRPSRIDTLIEVPLPDAEQRLEYLKFICRDGFEQPEKVLKRWAAASKDFSLAALKELVISMVIYNRPFKDTLARLKDLSKESD